MKKSILFLLFSIFVLTVFAQNEEEKVYSRKELKGIAKEEKKAKREAQDELLRKQTHPLLTMHRFVLEADYVGDGRGSRIPVNSTINFIAVDSSKAVIQLGTTSGIGYNGVGGITVDGNVTKYDLKINEGKKGRTYSLMFNVMTSLGMYDITLLVNSTGYTDATVRSTRSGQLKYSGNLVPIGLSKVYKGTSIF